MDEKRSLSHLTKVIRADLGERLRLSIDRKGKTSTDMR